MGKVLALRSRAESRHMHRCCNRMTGLDAGSQGSHLPYTLAPPMYAAYTRTCFALLLWSAVVVLRAPSSPLTKMPFTSNSTTHFGMASLKIMPIRKGTGRIGGVMYAATPGTGKFLALLARVITCLRPRRGVGVPLQRVLTVLRDHVLLFGESVLQCGHSMIE